MTNFELMNLLGCIFENGEVDALIPFLAEDCEYVSDYANVTVISASKIAARMKDIYSRIDDASRYAYKVIELESIMADGITLNDLDAVDGMRLSEHGLLLYQYDSDCPVAVVCVMVDLNGRLKHIMLSRKKDWFNVTFYEEDSPLDTPASVKPLTTHDRYVTEMESAFSGQYLHCPEEDDGSNIYIWRKADAFIKDWLKDKGYIVLESTILDDCIGYRCNRKNHTYTVYMYAYGQKKTACLDGGHCRKLWDNPFSEKSAVLIVYLNVKRYMLGKDVCYHVRSHSGNEDHSIELWRLNEVNGKPMLEYYPRREMIDATDKLMYAFNHDSADVYDCIMCEKGPSFSGLDHPGIFMNDAFFTSLLRLHEQYGDMRLGYVRYNDVVYSSVPYLEGYGFFSFRVDNKTDRILEVTAYPFDGGERKAAEFIKTEKRENENLYSYVPRLTDVVPLPPVETERFAVKLYFDNGECRKYVLPLSDADGAKDVISYARHVFTDRIWSTAKAVEHHASRYSGFPDCGPAIIFKNGFSLSALLCYEEGAPYAEPEPCDGIAYEDQQIKIKRLWKWKVNSIYEDEETGLMKALISGLAFNYHGVSTFASPEGRRLTSLDFDYIDNFKEGLAKVALSGYGYGYVDKDMRFVIPMKYDGADAFFNSKAKVKHGEAWYSIGKEGKETPVLRNIPNKKYQEVCAFSEGLCCVSTLKLRMMDLAYHSDYEEIAGVWGYINESGEEVIAPQYIYANDFKDGIAIVCKGKWTRDKKWDNEYNTGKYWTEEELWGAIDQSGKEVIPCKFDEIKNFQGTMEVFMAHYGGWENGRWGVIDRCGNWVVEPIFEDIGYEYKDGLFVFQTKNKWSGPDDASFGIYDLKLRKVLFEPQFFSVSFRDDDYIEVEVFDEKLGRQIEKLIDRNGKEKFYSEYTSIYTWKDPYEVMIRDENGNRHGLIDEDGNVLLPCKHAVVWNGISYEKKRIIFKENGKQGICDFDDRIIVPAEYYEIYGLDAPLLTVRVGEKGNYKEGLISQDGHEVLPAVYSRISWCRNNRLICCADGYCEVFQLVESS